MKSKFYKQLPKEAKDIRQAVFVEEQGFKNEFDDIDQNCWHLVLFENDRPIGCARMYKKENEMVLGRLAVIKDKRGSGVGGILLQSLEEKAKELGETYLYLSAQVRAKQFYLNNGYKEEGEEYLDEYCPHIDMRKVIHR